MFDPGSDLQGLRYKFLKPVGVLQRRDFENKAFFTLLLIKLEHTSARAGPRGQILLVKASYANKHHSSC